MNQADEGWENLFQDWLSDDGAPQIGKLDVLPGPNRSSHIVVCSFKRGQRATEGLEGRAGAFVV